MGSCSSPKFDNSDSDSDEECVISERRQMSDEEVMQYLHAFHQTQGFDMPSFRDSHGVGRIEVIMGSRLYTDQRIPTCAKAAIQHYNNEHGTNFEFVRIISANNQAAKGTRFYLTFEVKEEGRTPSIFQARVLSRCAKRGIEVQLCRPKPPT